MSYDSHDPVQTWSNKPKVFEPLSLEVLGRAYQRLAVCGLCGQKVGEAPILMVGDRVIHARCPDMSGVLRRTYRLGVIEVGPGYVRYWNRTAAGGPYALNAEQEARWREYLRR